MTVEWSRAADGDEKINGRYQRFKTCIGKGAFKSVYEAFDKTAQKDVAWNVVDLSQVRSGDELVKIRKETDILKSLKHRNILRIYDTWLNESQDRLIFITDIMRDGSLLKYIMNRDITLGRVKEFCKQILNALCYLHRGIGTPPKPIIHRDLKCDNIFIDASMNRVVLGDLGLSVVVSQKPIKGQSVVGTPEFMAPEMYEEKYNTKVDIYAFGMCLLQMVTKKYPYQECHTLHQVYKKVTKRELPAVLKTVISKSVKEYILNCCHFEQEHRPTAGQLLQHPFLNLQYPNDDLSCSEIVVLEAETSISSSPILNNRLNNLQPVAEEVLPTPHGHAHAPLRNESKQSNKAVNRLQEEQDRLKSVQAQHATQFTYRSDQPGTTKTAWPIERNAQIVRAEKYEDTGHFRIFLKILCESENQLDGRSNLAMKSVSFDYTPGEDTPRSIAREMVTDLGLKDEMLVSIEKVLSWESINEQLRIVQSDQFPHQAPRDLHVTTTMQNLPRLKPQIVEKSDLAIKKCMSDPQHSHQAICGQGNLPQFQQKSLPSGFLERAHKDDLSHRPVNLNDNSKGIHVAVPGQFSDPLQTRDQHTGVQPSQFQNQQYHNNQPTFTKNVAVGRSPQAVGVNTSGFSSANSSHLEAGYGPPRIGTPGQQTKHGSHYLVASPTQKTATSQQSQHPLPLSNYQPAASVHQKREILQPAQTIEASKYNGQSHPVKSYQQVSNYSLAQSYDHQMPLSHTPIKPLAPSNAKQKICRDFAPINQTGLSGKPPLDSSISHPLQNSQQFELATKEFSALQKSSSDQVDIPAESPMKSKSFEPLDSLAGNHGGNRPLIRTSVEDLKNKARKEVICRVISQGLVEESERNSRDKQSVTPGKLGASSDMALTATAPGNWSSTFSSSKNAQLDQAGKLILPPTHPRGKKQIPNLVPIDIQKTRRASSITKAYTAPNSSGTDPPIGSLSVTSPQCASSTSRDRALSEPGSPRKIIRMNSAQLDEEKLGRSRIEQERLNRKVKSKRAQSTKKTKKEQIKQKILEEQKKLSDKSLVGKDAKSGKGKEGSLTKTLTKKTSLNNEDIIAKVETSDIKSSISAVVKSGSKLARVCNPEQTDDERRLEWLKISRSPPQPARKQNESFPVITDVSLEVTQENGSKLSRRVSDIQEKQSSNDQGKSADSSFSQTERHTTAAIVVSPLTPPESKDKMPSEDLNTQNDFNRKVEKHLTTINRKLTDNRQKVMSEYRQRLDEINEHMELWYNNEKEKAVDPERKQRIVGHLSNFKTQFESMKEESKDFENHIGLQMPNCPITSSILVKSKSRKIQDHGL